MPFFIDKCIVDIRLVYILCVQTVTLEQRGIKHSYLSLRSPNTRGSAITINQGHVDKIKVSNAGFRCALSVCCGDICPIRASLIVTGEYHCVLNSPITIIFIIFHIGQWECK